MTDENVFKSAGKHFTKKHFVNPDYERLYSAYIFGCDAAEEELDESDNPYSKSDWRYDAWLYGFRSE